MNQTPALTVLDTPRIGGGMWLLLLFLLLPAVMFTWLGKIAGGYPHQTLWIVLLGLPMPLMLLSLPRHYVIDPAQQVLLIRGLLYRIRVPFALIESVSPISASRALVALGSFTCSDPARALKIKRLSGRDLIISPQNRAPFLALGRTAHQNRNDQDEANPDPNLEPEG